MHSGWFRGYGQFHEHGLPCYSPEEDQQQIPLDLDAILLMAQIEKAKAISDESAATCLLDQHGIMQPRVGEPVFYYL